MPGTTRLGYPIEFESMAIQGTATIVPGDRGSVHLVAGKNIAVDVKRDHVSKFRLLDELSCAEISPLEPDGDYVVRGKVIFSHDAGTFGVEVGDCIITLHGHDSLGRRPSVGQLVSFHLHGMTLWDRGPGA